MSLTIALTLMVAGCASVAFECAAAGSILIGSAVLIVRFVM